MAAGRPALSICHAPVTLRWLGYLCSESTPETRESTFLNTLSRLAKAPASEEFARYPTWKTPFCHALSRTCHAPVMTKSMLILVTTKCMLILVMTKKSFGLLSALFGRLTCIYIYCQLDGFISSFNICHAPVTLRWVMLYIERKNNIVNLINS